VQSDCASASGRLYSQADGQTITNDCAACHQIIVSGENKPKIMTDLGMN
jgi:cytochrome c2